jgi:hypothetical protein
MCMTAGDMTTYPPTTPSPHPPPHPRTHPPTHPPTNPPPHHPTTARPVDACRSWRSRSTCMTSSRRPSQACTQRRRPQKGLSSATLATWTHWCSHTSQPCGSPASCPQDSSTHTAAVQPPCPAHRITPPQARLSAASAVRAVMLAGRGVLWGPQTALQGPPRVHVAAALVLLHPPGRPRGVQLQGQGSGRKLRSSTRASCSSWGPQGRVCLMPPLQSSPSHHCRSWWATERQGLALSQ